MTLDQYQERLCSTLKRDVWWGGLTIELSIAVGAVCGCWSDIITCPPNSSSEQFDVLKAKLSDKLGDVINILARLNASVGEPLSAVYKFAYHDGMGEDQTTKYVLRLAKSSSEFLCPDQTDKEHDVKHVIVENSVLIMHDMINVVLSLHEKTIEDIAKDNLIKLLSKEKDND